MANRKKYGSEVKWIAISINIFDDEKIKIIEEMPEGDTIIVVWLKLLISAGRVNDCGMVYIDKNIPYTIETLATVFHRPINTVRLALDTFQRLGMITISDTRTILLKNWYKYQQQDSLEKIREQGRIRQQRFRENQAEKLLENKSNVTSNANVTLHNALHDITLHDNTQQEESVIINDSTSCCCCINEEEKENSTTSPTPILNSDQKLYGEFGNVCLTDHEYGKLLSMTLDQKFLDKVVEELSQAIGIGKYPPYKAECPNAHFILLRKFIEWHRKHPESEQQKPSQYKTKSQELNELYDEIDRVCDELRKKEQENGTGNDIT